MRTKGDVGADVYVDDAPEHIEALVADDRDVIVCTNSTNRHIKVDGDHRTDSWPELVDMVLLERKHPSDRREGIVSSAVVCQMPVEMAVGQRSWR